MPIKKAWQKHLRGLWQGIHGCGQGGKAPYPVTGSLRSFQEKNESANYIVLSRRKICAHCLKIYCIFPFLTELPSILCKGCCFNSPPPQPSPLHPTKDACPIKLYLFPSSFRKSIEGCNRICQGHYMTELQDWHCSCIYSNVFNIHVQRANRSSRSCVRISRFSFICWSSSYYSIQGENS